MKVYITQIIYINAGQEDIFNEFEAIAIPLIAQYDGKLLLRIRLGANEIIEGSMDNPYEIHVIEFESDERFKAFMEDTERQRFLHLKEQSIRSTLVVKGNRV